MYDTNRKILQARFPGVGQIILVDDFLIPIDSTLNQDNAKIYKDLGFNLPVPSLFEIVALFAGRNKTNEELDGLPESIVEFIHKQRGSYQPLPSYSIPIAPVTSTPTVISLSPVLSRPSIPSQPLSTLRLPSSSKTNDSFGLSSHFMLDIISSFLIGGGVYLAITSIFILQPGLIIAGIGLIVLGCGMATIEFFGLKISSEHSNSRHSNLIKPLCFLPSSIETP
jgi:hypothetical protein